MQIINTGTSTQVMITIYIFIYPSIYINKVLYVYIKLVRTTNKNINFILPIKTDYLFSPSLFIFESVKYSMISMWLLLVYQLHHIFCDPQPCNFMVVQYVLIW